LPRFRLRHEALLSDGVRIGALYDIHGNLPALDAALADAEGEGVDLVVIGGDVAWGPLPSETVERLLGLGSKAHFIRGNADREVAARAGEGEGLDEMTARINRWCADQLTDEQRRWLGGLPTSEVADVDDLGPVLFCHGSPRSDEETITTATPEVRVEEMLEDVEQSVVVCGHTHAQFERTVGRVRVVNAGSVGLPFGEPGAHWLLLGPHLALRRTRYDFEAAARLFRDNGGPGADDFAEHVMSPPPAATAAELYTRY
jgi:putative phosphoesterase